MSKQEYPLVSVIVRVCNQEEFIEKALKSILSQHYKGNIELIIADDHSTDHTPSLIRKTTESLPSNFILNYTYHPKNKGMVGNFLWGLQQATGEYIAICDADDYWVDPLKIQKQVQFILDYPECSMIGHAYKELYLDTDQPVIKQKVKKASICTLTDFLNGKGFRAATPTMLFRKGIVEKTEDWLQKSDNIDDFALYLISGHYGKYGYLPDIMACAYRKASAESWSTKAENLEGTIKYIQDKNDFYAYFNQLTGGIYDQAILESEYRTIRRHIFNIQKKGLSRMDQITLIKPYWIRFIKPTKPNILFFLNLVFGYQRIQRLNGGI